MSMVILVMAGPMRTDISASEKHRTTSNLSKCALASRTEYSRILLARTNAIAAELARERDCWAHEHVFRSYERYVMYDKRSMVVTIDWAGDPVEHVSPPPGLA